MFKSSIFILSLVSTVSASAMTVTSYGAAAYACAHNPMIAAARQRIEEARGRLMNAGRLSNPELELEYSQSVRSPEGMPGGSLCAAVSGHGAASAGEGGLRELKRQQLVALRNRTEFVVRRVVAGEAAPTDATMAELEAQQLSVEMVQLDGARRMSLTQLRPLLGLAAAQHLRLTGSLATPDSPSALVLALENRPDFRAAMRYAEAAGQNARLARAQTWQAISTGLTASGGRIEHAAEGFQHEYFIGLRFNVPLPLWNRGHGRIAEAQAAAERAQREIEAVALRIRAEQSAARTEMTMHAKVVAEMDGTLLPKATQVEEQWRSSDGNGQAPLVEVLLARARRLELAQRRVNAVPDYHLARMRYEAAVGKTTPAKGEGDQ